MGRTVEYFFLREEWEAFDSHGVAFLGAHGYGHGVNDHRHLGRRMERRRGIT
jgi:hypothetical protein